MAERIEGRQTPQFTSKAGVIVQEKLHAEIESARGSTIHETVVGMRLRCPLSEACHLEGRSDPFKGPFEYRYECRSPQDESCAVRTEALADAAEANLDTLMEKISQAIGNAISDTELSFPS